jgi:hypothetical protein
MVSEYTRVERMVPNSTLGKNKLVPLSYSLLSCVGKLAYVWLIED